MLNIFKHTFPPQFSQKLIDFLRLLFRLSSLKVTNAMVKHTKSWYWYSFVDNAITRSSSVLVNIWNDDKDVPPPLRSTTLLLAPVHRGAARGVQLVPKSSASYLRPETSCVHFASLYKIKCLALLKSNFHELRPYCRKPNSKQECVLTEAIQSLFSTDLIFICFSTNVM